MKLKICTVFYNEWDIDPLTGKVQDNDSPLPIERSIAALKLPFEWAWKRARATYIAKGRNALINLLSNERVDQSPAEDYTHYLFVDSDVSGFEQGQIEKLLAWDLPIVSGAYLERKSQDCFCAGRFPAPPHDRGEFVNAETTGMQKIDWVGAGFLLIKREVFEKLEYPWFQFCELHYVDEEGKRCVTEEPEDLSFCRKARAAGYEIYIDCDCRVKHHIHQNKGSKRMENANQTQQGQQMTIVDWKDGMSELTLRLSNNVSFIAGQFRQLEAEYQKLAKENAELKAKAAQLEKDTKDQNDAKANAAE